ncbi:hypothetical protein HELRODRAFT_162786 [Helobdella robusta]|uniref:Uncharacterized protein n=1 Tax=Helobdella robusta TaxID=6412 RepID=T1ET53_HELRO|nr:hypothetical protein HELRODRAFT_162786 [Helobdella robusta]ESN99268.1 hypothetical protein HELRODRAFT_162786 [Helobdella robusta]
MCTNVTYMKALYCKYQIRSRQIVLHSFRTKRPSVEQQKQLQVTNTSVTKQVNRYSMPSLMTLVGIIIYIGAITEEASSKAQSKDDNPAFIYEYGPSLLLAMISFVGCQMTGVVSINHFISVRKGLGRLKVKKKISDRVSASVVVGENVEKNKLCFKTIYSNKNYSGNIGDPDNYDTKKNFTKSSNLLPFQVNLMLNAANKLVSIVGVNSSKLKQQDSAESTNNTIISTESIMSPASERTTSSLGRFKQNLGHRSETLYTMNGEASCIFRCPDTIAASSSPELSPGVGEIAAEEGAIRGLCLLKGNHSSELILSCSSLAALSPGMHTEKENKFVNRHRTLQQKIMKQMTLRQQQFLYRQHQLKQQQHFMQKEQTQLKIEPSELLTKQVQNKSFHHPKLNIIHSDLLSFSQKQHQPKHSNFHDNQSQIPHHYYQQEKLQQQQQQQQHQQQQHQQLQQHQQHHRQQQQNINQIKHTKQIEVGNEKQAANSRQTVEVDSYNNFTNIKMDNFSNNLVFAYNETICHNEDDVCETLSTNIENNDNINKIESNNVGENIINNDYFNDNHPTSYSTFHKTTDHLTSKAFNKYHFEEFLLTQSANRQRNDYDDDFIISNEEESYVDNDYDNDGEDKQERTTSV